MVKIAWHGHACVSISREDGYTIVIDPHDGSSLGLRKPEVKGDLVLVTHNHFDHNAVDVVTKPRSRMIKEFHGETDIDGLRIKGFKTFHDKQRGKRRGFNYVYLIEVSGKRIAHLGDLGDMPAEDVIGELRGLDLLIVPVGGVFTVDPDEAWNIVEKTQPLNILPIHYWVRGVNLPLKPLEEFLKHVRGYSVVELDSGIFNLEEYEKKVIIPKLA